MGLLKNKRLTKENKKEQVKEEQNLIIKNKEPEEIKFCRLDKEIKREQMKRRINSFKKSQKPKKSLKKRLLAWGLGVSIFAGAAVGIGFGISAGVNANEQKEYNNAIQTRYEQVDKTLTKAMEPTYYDNYSNSEVTGIYFEEPMEDGTTLMVFYEGEYTNQFGTERPTRAAEFNVGYEYYNNLVVAEESDNMLDYLDCLNDVFANMTFVKEQSNSFVSLHLPYNSEENIAVFNNIFNVDGLNSNVSKQIGFTPYYVKLENSEIINQNPITHSYTYKIYGVSYCETKSESTAYIKNSDKLIMSENYDNNHLKAYNRVMTFSSIAPTDILYEELRLSGDIYMIIDGVNYPYTVTNEYFGEVNVFEDYFKMQDGKFDYEKPEDLNLDDYQK